MTVVFAGKDLVAAASAGGVAGGKATVFVGGLATVLAGGVATTSAGGKATVFVGGVASVLAGSGVSNKGPSKLKTSSAAEGFIGGALARRICKHAAKECGLRTTQRHHTALITSHRLRIRGHKRAEQVLHGIIAGRLGGDKLRRTPRGGKISIGIACVSVSA